MTAEDASEFDLPFWRNYWNLTESQGVIVSAGGQIAFYPTDIPDQPRAPGLGRRDLFGELCRAARDDGREVLARLSLHGSPELVLKHPNWANVDANGKRRATPCMNGGYFYEYGADIVREVAQRYRPSGFTLSGWGQNYSLCYCETCTMLFHEHLGEPLPRERNWEDPLYRRWVAWNSDQVIALWDHGNQVAKAVGGADCIWIGQLLGSILTRNLKRLADRAQLIMIDHQAPEDDSGLADNSLTGKTLNGLTDWKKPLTVATAFYAPRLNSPPKSELTLWMAEGMAGGARPWWNMIGGYTEDKRRFPMLPPLLQWHTRNERYLFDRRPVASVGVVWSDINNLYYGRDAFTDRVLAPYQGMVKALTRARIPFVVVHADDLDRDAIELAGIILPNLAAMTDDQLRSVQRFASRGGGVLATGETSLYDQYGDPRADFGLAELFGVHQTGMASPPAASGLSQDQMARTQIAQMEVAGAYIPNGLIERLTVPQSFLRLVPALRRETYGPHRHDEPTPNAGRERHRALRGFDATDLIYFGGTLRPLRVASDATVLLTFVPPVPTAMPEESVFKVRETDLPGLVVREPAGGAGRVAYLPADLDRLYDRLNQPDHADLLANLVQWTSKEISPLVVEGHGLFDFNLYHQQSRMIVHIDNLTNSAAWRGPIDEFAPSGPLDLRVKLHKDVEGSRAYLLVGDGSVSVTEKDGWASVRVPSVVSQEVLVIE